MMIESPAMTLLSTPCRASPSPTPATPMPARSGAVYVFRRNTSGTWAQEAYLKAETGDIDDLFGVDVDVDHRKSGLRDVVLGHPQHGFGAEGFQRQGTAVAAVQRERRVLGSG